MATVLLTVAECPWRCTMCDLWKHTLQHPTPAGAVVHQLRQALAELPSQANWIKLYNAGSFFDAKSIPRTDWEAIAELCRPFERVIVENHPRLCGPRMLPFQELLDGQLEIALGVESLQPGMLRRLNKGMSRDDIDRALAFHDQHGIDTRAFVLVRPPWCAEGEAIAWTQLTLRHLLGRGVRHISLIPTRAGNGWLDRLQTEGRFEPPTIETLETLHRWALQQVAAGTANATSVITVDLWDWPPAGACPHCAGARGETLHRQNLTQQVMPSTHCHDCQRPRSDARA